MAWNQSSTEQKQKTARKPSPLRGVVAGLVVVAAAVGAYFAFTGKDAKPAEKPVKKAELIKEVAPATNRVSAAQAEKDAHPGMVKVRGKWYPEYNKKGGRIWVTKYDVRYHSPVVHTNTSNTTFTSREYKIFTNQADRDIAQMLTCPVGAVVIGDWNFDKRFVKDFIESLKTPIIVTKDDDEWSAELKRSVTETKIELKARYDAGEDIAKIMNDTRKELQQQGVYKLQLEESVRQQVREAKGDAAAQKDAYDAANKMLVERGMEPLAMPAFIARRQKIESKSQADEPSPAPSEQ